MGDRRLIGDRYRLGEVLGRGGMGVVYYGTDTHTNQPVALKTLEPEHIAGEPEMVERFAREAEALRDLNHPNIVKVFETISEEDAATGVRTQYIVIEFVGAGSLRDLLEQEKQLDLRTTLEIGLDLADALTRSHRLQIIHRDLKPANVLLAEDGSPRLTDFGIARFGDGRFGQGARLTQTGMTMGTIDYLSPEACRGEELDARADIWALGVILFEMLAGRRPFSGDTLATVLTSILTQPLPDLEALRPEAPEALVDLVYRMLIKEREARIPSMRLVGAELERILQDAESDQQDAAIVQPAQLRFVTPTPRPSGMSRHNLPKQTTPFIGRSRELANLTKLLAGPDNHLITLIGPGGAGKTRLALEAATAQLSNFSDGIHFVPLVSLSSAEDIIPAIAKAAGFRFFEGVEVVEQLFDYFRGKRSLLLLDNFEHVLDGADLVEKLLRSGPEVKMLVTSREKLNLQEEIRFRIEGMDFPGESQPTSLAEATQYSAIRLFSQAAKRARPSFELHMEDVSYIIRICRLVRGMPLGILLAATWVEMFSPREIAEEVGRSLDFLETEVRDIPERHRSQRAVFDSSWKQIPEVERQMFMKLAIFRGGFRREAARAVAGASLRQLVTLVNKSLLHRDPTTGRYEVHELLRQYAEERLDVLGEANLARSAHCAYYAAFLQKRLGAMLGPKQIKALDEIEAEYGNVRQAWRWAVDTKNYDAIERASESLFVYSDMRSREHEGVELLALARERLAPLSGEKPHPIWERLLLPWYDLMLQSKGRPKDGHGIKTQAQSNLALAQKREDAFGIAHGLIMLGHFTEPDEAINMYEQALILTPRMDDSFWVRIRIGFCFQSLGEHQKAIKAFQRSYERGRQIGESEKMGWSLYNLAETELALGDQVNARTHFRAANGHLRQVGNLLGIVWTNANLSLMALVAGKLEESRSLLEEAQKVARDANRTGAIKKDEVVITGYLALIDQDYQRAQTVFEGILSPDVIVPELSLGLSYAAYGLEDRPTAGRFLQEALHAPSPFKIPAMRLLCLPAAALISLDEGQEERAVQLLALAHEQPEGLGLLDEWPLLIHLQTELGADLGQQAFDAAWASGRALGLGETLAILADRFQSETQSDRLSDGRPSIPLYSGGDSLLEPLSEREMEVLQLLKSDLSGPEIAGEMMVSLNTVRFHTKNIYSKFHVNNRRAAVRRAMELGL